MPFVLLAILIGVPLLELAVIIKVGGAIGVLPTIALLIGVGILGTVLLRAQGLAAMRRAGEALASGRPPVASAIDGLGLLMAGILMLTPGFLTDILGLLLLVPPVRQRLGRWVFAQLSGRVLTRTTNFRRGPAGGRRGPLIDGEYTREDDHDRPLG